MSLLLQCSCFVIIGSVKGVFDVNIIVIIVAIAIVAVITVTIAIVAYIVIVGFVTHFPSNKITLGTF